MVNTETFTQKEWQILSILQNRYPSFDANLRKLYWDTYEEIKSSDKGKTETIADKILDKYPKIDLREKDKKERLPVLNTSKHVNLIIDWLEDVFRYEKSLNKLTDIQINDLFNKMINTEASMLDEIPVINQPADKDELFATQDKLCLRFSTWTEEEAVLFCVGNSNDKNYSMYLEQLKTMLKTNPKFDHLTPEKFLLWAKEQKWKMKLPYKELKYLDPNSIPFDASNKRIPTLYKMLLGIVIDKYNYEINSPISNRDIPAKIHTKLLTHGIKITAETIRKTLDDAVDVFREQK